MCIDSKIFALLILLPSFNFITLSRQRYPSLIIKDSQDVDEMGKFEKLLSEILVSIQKIKCVAIICDEIYCDIFTKKLFSKIGLNTTFFLLNTKENESISGFHNRSRNVLNQIRIEGCELYIIFMSNGTKLTNFLHFSHRERLMNTRANVILLYDLKLFQKEMHFLWKIIINVIFIRKHNEKSKFDNKTIDIWYDISTVPFPYPIKTVLVPIRINTWRKGRFRIGTHFFYDKTTNLKNQTMRIVTFPHIPATAKFEMTGLADFKTSLNSGSFQFKGAEVEIVRALSKAMNFIPLIYEPPDAESEKWGQVKDGQFSGLIGEMIRFQADVALGDLYNSPLHLILMDLSIPYNTECLTFLTPVSLKDNSWMTLVLPFKLYMWVTILVALFTLGIFFYGLAKFYYNFYDIYESKHESQYTESNDPRLKKVKIHTSYYDLKMENKHHYNKPKGLYIFGEIVNSILYTYGMLLLISLPRFPSGWSLRMLTGWYSLYCSLVAVSYRASMTAILANPTPRITIDTLEELEASGLPCGGWGETVKYFFETLSDKAGQKIAEKFEQVNDSDFAIHRVATGKFAYYENSFYLKAASVKRQLQSKDINEKKKINNETIERNDRDLHIMNSCVINMPISIGLQKNSPVKDSFDKYIRRIIEAGFVKKWLDDIMQISLNAEIHTESTKTTKALMNLQKFYGAFVALFAGYLFSVVTIITEIVYYHYKVKKHPYYDKYSRKIVYPKYYKIDSRKII